MKRIYAKLSQWVLNEWGAKPKLKEDGIFGEKSKKAASKILMVEFDTASRYIALTVQKVCNKHEDIPELEEDGRWGSDTQDGAERMIGKLGWTNEEVLGRPENPENEKGGSTIKCWVPTNNQLKAAYGSVNSVAGKLQRVNLPFPMKLDWDTDSITTRFSAHPAAVIPFEKAFGNLLDHYGLKKIKSLGLDRYGGCYNKRPIRGGTVWSTHAWGIAIDIYPSRNQLRWNHSKALFATKPYKEFFEIFEAEGFMSLGRCRDFDYMHLQLNPK